MESETVLGDVTNLLNESEVVENPVGESTGTGATPVGESSEARADLVDEISGIASNPVNESNGTPSNPVNENSKTETNPTPRVALVRINTKRSAYLDYHKEWSNGNSHIDPSTIFCLEGSCGEVLEMIDSLM